MSTATDEFDAYTQFVDDLEADLAATYGEQKAKSLVGRLDREQFDTLWRDAPIRQRLRDKLKHGYEAERNRIVAALDWTPHSLAGLRDEAAA